MVLFSTVQKKQKVIGDTAGGVALAILLIATGCLALFFFCKRHKAKTVVVKEEINDTYGDYYADPDAVVEMTDHNDYYAGDYDCMDDS